MNLRHYASQVEQFHETFDTHWPTPTKPVLRMDTVKARHDIMREEIEETHEAWKQMNRLEVLDGLCDTQYVLSGTILACGFRDTFAYNIVPGFFSDGDAGKLAAFSMLKAKLKAFLVFAEAGNVIETSKSLVLMQQVTSGLVDAFGFTHVFGDAFDAVHENNMDKLWSHSQALEYFGDGTKFPTASGETLSWVLNPGGFIVRRADGKILKPVGHSKVDISRFI